MILPLSLDDDLSDCVEVSEWSEWGSCEASCGKGVMKRSLKPPPGVRIRKKHDCSKVEERALCEVSFVT